MKNSNLIDAVLSVHIAVREIYNDLKRKGYVMELTTEPMDSYQGLKKQDKKIIVSNIGNSTSIWGTACNLHMRFWHDIMHINLNKGFSQLDEQDVIKEQVIQLSKRGVSELGLRLFKMDMYGQNDYYNHNGVYVKDQTKFVLYALENGLSKALSKEL